MSRRRSSQGRPPRDASRRYHDRVARQYDSIYDDAYWMVHDRLTWSAIRPHLPRDLSSACCDLGCGTGKWGLRLLKSGFATTFVDHAAAMVEQARAKADAIGAQAAARATFVVADIVSMPQLDNETFDLTVAMGDPLSICSDAAAAVREMFRCTRPGGIVIATADNQLAALDHYMAAGDLDALEHFVHTGKTHWLTPDVRERFELSTFTPHELHRLFERAGFEVVSLVGKTILPLRQHKQMLQDERSVERLIRLEEDLAKDPSSPARAAHLQITARRAASRPAATA